MCLACRQAELEREPLRINDRVDFGRKPASGATETMICVCAPPSCRRSLLMGTNGSAVDHLDVAVVCGGDGVHHPTPYTRLPPPHEAVVAGSARAVPLWQITPRRAGSQHPKNAVQHAAIVDGGPSGGLVGKKRLDHALFEVGQVISAHAYAESDFACPANPIYEFTALVRVLSASVCFAPKSDRRADIRDRQRSATSSHALFCRSRG